MCYDSILSTTDIRLLVLAILCLIVFADEPISEFLELSLLFKVDVLLYLWIYGIRFRFCALIFVCVVCAKIEK